jgi:hypothetical protein
MIHVSKIQRVYNVFDHLRNKAKLFLSLDKLSVKGLNKNLICCLPTKSRNNFFVLRTSCLTYQNNLLSTRHCTNTKFVQHLKLYHVLFCFELFCQGLIFCRSNGSKEFMNDGISSIHTPFGDLNSLNF